MNRLLVVVWFAGGLQVGAFGADAPRVFRHVTVYSQAGRYGGWPANHGVWSWGNEIVVGFSAAYYQWIGPDRHPYDRSKPEEPYLARAFHRTAFANGPGHHGAARGFPAKGPELD